MSDDGKSEGQEEKLYSSVDHIHIYTPTHTYRCLVVDVCPGVQQSIDHVFRVIIGRRVQNVIGKAGGDERGDPELPRRLSKCDRRELERWRGREGGRGEW